MSRRTKCRLRNVSSVATGALAFLLSTKSVHRIKTYINCNLYGLDRIRVKPVRKFGWWVVGGGVGHKHDAHAIE